MSQRLHHKSSLLPCMGVQAVQMFHMEITAAILLGVLSCQFLSVQGDVDQCHFILQDINPAQHTSTTVCCRATNTSTCEISKSRYLLDDQEVVFLCKLFEETSERHVLHRSMQTFGSTDGCC